MGHWLGKIPWHPYSCRSIVPTRSFPRTRLACGREHDNGQPPPSLKFDLTFNRVCLFVSTGYLIYRSLLPLRILRRSFDASAFVHIARPHLQSPYQNFMSLIHRSILHLYFSQAVWH
jgi:hypothetical protein